ncbi:hypothetical protein [Acidovorax sp. sic0104]|uniref:hypothetical protein n=1 Tax=Acidovorax sp. sic0104 TaxID=2854784 RepID=UPI001C49123A|nr:hypothetical protein [Acidovorax sp. sic0104]MBV7543591.1 hypothetical protein [Acidovorax sp. sic0104]
MNIDEAKNIMKCAQELGEFLSEIGDIASAIPDPELEKRIRQEIGVAMIKVFRDFMHPIMMQFPELDPDVEDPRLNPSRS